MRKTRDYGHSFLGTVWRKCTSSHKLSMTFHKVVIIVTKNMILWDKTVIRVAKYSAMSDKIVSRVLVVHPSNFLTPRQFFRATHKGFFSFREKCDSQHNILKTGTNLCTSPVFLTPFDKNVILARKFLAMWDKRLMQLKKILSLRDKHVILTTKFPSLREEVWIYSHILRQRFGNVGQNCTSPHKFFDTVIQNCNWSLKIVDTVRKNFEKNFTKFLCFPDKTVTLDSNFL